MLPWKEGVAGDAEDGKLSSGVPIRGPQREPGSKPMPVCHFLHSLRYDKGFLSVGLMSAWSSWILRKKEGAQKMVGQDAFALLPTFPLPFYAEALFLSHSECWSPSKDRDAQVPQCSMQLVL